MIHSGWIAIVAVVVSSLGLPVARAESDPNTKIADLFEVTLDSAKYDDSISVIHSSEGRREQTIQRLRLNCEIDIADANLVLGTSRRGVITHFKNGTGEIVEDLDQKLLRPGSMFQRYQGLRYRRQFVPPKKPAKWKTAIRSFLRLPPLKRSRPQWLDKLAPSWMMLELDTGLLGPDTERISRIEGHFHVLMAESLEHIDMPFKPTEGWVRAAPGLEVKVLEAQTAESRYKYRIETRREENAFRGPLTPAADLPERLPVDQQLIGRDGKPTRHRIGSLRLPSSGVRSGSGSGSGRNVGPIEKFRFVIAVNPSHHKIPFVLEDISLPSPDAADPARAAPRSRRRAQAVPYAPTDLLSETIHQEKWIKLSWEPVPGAASYDVYLGESFEDVNDGVYYTFQGNKTATFLIAGFPGMAYPGGLVPGKTYYWRVDEVDNSKADSPRRGKVLSFSVAPRAAFNPFPADGTKSVDPNVTLRWTEGLKARLHTVYFGDDLDTVTNAANGQIQGAKTFSPRALVPGTTYYWRVDELAPPATYKGKVWSFTVGEATESRQVKD